MDVAGIPPQLVAALAGLTALVLSFAFTPLVRALAVRLNLIARPVHDRWGRRVIARLGGVAMFVAFVIAALLWTPLEPRVVAILVGSALVFALGLVDDLHRMAPYTKLVCQLLIGCAVVVLGIRLDLGERQWLSIPLSVLWLVLVMNAFNLLDNMDGLAAGVGAIASAVCAFHVAHAGQPVLVALALMLCGVCLGFLRFNFPPAKIYMGDSGSHFVGLGLASLTAMGSWHHSTSLMGVLLLPALVLAVPIFDTCFVTIQRLANRRSPFVGGTDHVSHRLAILGLTERQTVLALYALSAGLGLLGLVSASMHPLPALACWGIALTGLVLFGRYLSQVNVYRLAAGQEPVPEGQAVTPIDTMLLHKRRLLEILLDFCVVSSAYVFAHLLRFEGNLSGHLQSLIVQSLPMMLGIKLACFAGCGLYQRVWRYPDLSDIITIAKAVTLGSFLSSLALLYAWRFAGYSRAVLIIDWMLLFLAMAGSRVAERLFNEWIGSATPPADAVVIIGAGETGERVLKYLKYGGKSSKRIVGFLDDDANKAGMRIHGFRVLGTRQELPMVLQRHGVREILVAISDPPAELVDWIADCARPHGARWQVVTAGLTGAVV
jgi:UDP-GlcNAc:undecaprenyl-phosphate GlcNAc-1-phosphate transferase